MDKRVVIASLVSGIVGAAAGGAITYFTVKKTFEERAQRDIDEVKAHYAEKFDGKKVVNNYHHGNMPGPAADTNADEIVHTPVGDIRRQELHAAQEFVKGLGYATPVPVKTGPDEIVVSVEEKVVNVLEVELDSDAGTEIKDRRLIGYDAAERRANHKPYLISNDDFHNTETEWDKLSITYYEDDDTLVDEREQVVTDIEYLVGEIHLNFFGIESGDKNQVYVRAPQISTDFEITRRSVAYTEAVLNIPKGSDQSAVRRMRESDGY